MFEKISIRIPKIVCNSVDRALNEISISIPIEMDSNQCLSALPFGTF